jgi:hypothetical protein
LFSGLEGDDHEADPTRSPPRTPVQTVDERIALDVDESGFAVPRPPIRGLRDGEVRLLQVDGLPEARSAAARQCTADDAVCAPSVPILADDRGRATFLFQFAAGLPEPSGSCAPSGCVLVIDDDDRVRQATVSLDFGADAAGGSIRLDRRRRLSAGDELEVRLAGLAPGPVTVSFCTPPGPVDPAHCGSPAPEVEVVVGTDGTASARLPVHIGPVGTADADCRRGDRCGVAVLRRPDIAVAEIGFAGSADAQPGRTQTIAGLAVAGLLVIVAVVAIRRRPWTPPDGDPFEGIILDDPFDGIDLLDDTDDQPATSRRANDTEPIPSNART